MVKWSRVDEDSRNGIITRYTIDYEDATKENKGTEDILAPATETIITGLRQKAKYFFKILAATSKGDGPYSDTKEEETEAPPIVVSKGTTTVIIPFWNKQNLSSGETVSYFQVIVMPLKKGQEPGNSADSKYENVTRKYQDRVEGEPYITAEFSKKDAKATFPVGDGKVYSRIGVKVSKRKRRNVNKPVIEYLNGKLNDNTQYAAFQRSFAEDGNYDNEGFITFITKRDYTVEMVVGILVLLFVVVVIALAIFIYRRRRRQNESLDGGMPMQKKPRRPTASRILGRGIDNPNFIPGGIIPVEEFEGHVRRLHANDDLLFSQEYATLRPASDTASDATLAQENRYKNRYNNIVAYDHSRVKLIPISNVPGSDYINANYLDGYNKEKAYIATQGPLPDTTEDFWRMVWEQNSKIIVMVTNLEERGRIKCSQYWPSEGRETHGDIQVQLTETVELSDFTIRKFCLKKSSSKDERMVSQYHYTIWPDHGVPSCPTSLLAFVKKASAANPTDAGPMVVHCSAGVGRTGTFVVVDAMLQRIAAEKTVDVFGYVSSLRRNRNLMVQVEAQYVFIHEALLEAIHSGYTEVQAVELRAHIKNLMEVNLNTGQTGMDEEFNHLGRGGTAQPSKFQAANMHYNKTKNRYANVLAFDDSRVKLSVLSGIEGSDYINASFIDGYKTRRAFIATQAPIPDTIPDFWRMIWEQESSTVVMLSRETEKGKVWTNNTFFLINAGVKPAGVFCSLSIVIERLKSEGVVDVFQTIKVLRTQRPAMVQTQDQYEFIYRALREYLDSFDAYSNFEADQY
ncbi:PREDICTED: receptor-type tyrosine-protein phosphatase delta-like [Acropora digitifera]|uniref:receptor-type tyrosine-protein phosphatase delta-like n=1 Tax=Acropora digitifera TaxID=70779 RepID=UPI00077B1E57|nr:PREDICTED: receptor-type tyrosine-protein phosphatase delta-like [Acropora digitifera]